MKTYAQELQEEEYKKPYHWELDRSSPKGAVFFSYWNMAIKKAGELKGKEVLDAGCGDGFFSSWIVKENPKRLVGVDYSQRAVSFAQKSVPEGTFVKSNLTSLPFSNESFDIIFLTEVLEHILEKERDLVIRELARILKKEGKIIVTVPSDKLKSIEKHEIHFSKDLLESVFGPYASLVEISGQDKGGVLRWYLDLFLRLFRNRLWRIGLLVWIWSRILYPLFLSRSPLVNARRFVAVFVKE